MATIFDVAAHAGVSIKTVSRVLNRQGNVNAAMRENVLRAVAALDYTPNLAARQLSSRKSYLICMPVLGLSNSNYFARMVVAAANTCRQHGYHFIPETFDPAETKEEVIGRITAKLRPDGIILSPPLSSDPAAIAAVAARGTPLALLGGVPGEYGRTIEIHARGVSRQLVEHLLASGHRRIAMIAPPPEHRAANERVDGYRDALAAAGLGPDPALIVAGDFSYAAGIRAAQHLLDLPNRPTAIFAANDVMALGTMAVAARRSLRVPDDLAVAGFDDTPAGRMAFPPLTTVSQPIPDMIRAAIAVILDPGSIIPPIDHRLLIRGSTTGSMDLVDDTLD